MRNDITFKKLILLFSIVIIPFFLITLFLLQQNNATVRSRVFHSIQEKADLTAHTLTTSLEQIYHTATEMAGQSNIQKLTTSSYPKTKYDVARDTLQLKEQQTSIKNANPYIENVIIYYLDKLQAYNSDGNNLASFFTFTPEEFQTLADARTASDFLILNQQSLSEIILPSFHSNFLIRVDLSPTNLVAALEQTFPEYQIYYLLDSFDHKYQLTNLSEESLQSFLNDDTIETCVIEKQPHYVFSSSIPYGNTQLYFFFSNEQLFADTKIYQSLTLFFFLLVILTFSIFLWGSYTIVHKPIQALIHAFQDINQQNYDVRISYQKNSDFDYLYREFNHMAEQLGTLIEKDYQQQILLNKSELKQLQAQINPHFLYNSLFLLRRMIGDELYEEAYHMSDIFGQYFQYITRNSQDYVPLEQEYQHAMIYCEIQKLRFEERIRIETDELPAEYSHILVPKLIIQPILENAFHYGLHDKITDGLLKVTIFTKNDTLIISVEDNNDELSDTQLETIQKNLKNAAISSSLQEMTGMLNIQRRLRIYFGSSSELSAQRGTSGGLCIQILLPAHTNHLFEKE